MAFQQQHHRPSSARPVLYTDSAPPKLDTLLQPPTETEEWVLFSPAQNRTEGESTATPQTQPLSYFGSLDTAARSDQYVDEEQEEDLDSLDDGLHAFDDPRAALQDPLDQSATVLPTHDGLGTFPGTSSPVQQQFWQHEHTRSKPQSQSLRRESLQRHFDALEQQPSHRMTDADKTLRIEKWRQEQSHAILEEIEKETKRLRRKSRMHSSQHTDDVGSVSDTTLASAALPSHTSAKSETWWQRFTRQIIRNLIGIDDATMTFIFGGESTENRARNASSQEEMIRHAEEVLNEDNTARCGAGSSWDEKLLARVAKELGLLIHKISEHPGDYDSFLKSSDDIPYAGLTQSHNRHRSSRPRHHPKRLHAHSSSVPSTPVFEPTLAPFIARHSQHRRRSSTHATDPSLWGIEEEDVSADGARPTSMPTRDHQEEVRRKEEARYDAERAYWEKDLDVGMVFNYLKSRLSARTASDQQVSTEAQLPQTFRKMTTSYSSARAGDSLRRVALIRHHHPLVASATNRQPDDGRDIPSPATEASAALMQPRQSQTLSPAPVLGRRSSASRFLGEGYAESCASQSTTKKSKTKHSGSLASLGSSRNYWDLGNSVGSGQAWSGGGWGEV